MCGLVGFIDSKGRLNHDLAVVVRKMAQRLARRGPDDEGVWTDQDVNFALAHRRLAIIDLSSAGHQPMHSECGRYVLAFNGEIYNHLELRRELGGAVQWRGGSDTETLLTAIIAWGVERALQKTVGMFALALWDRNERELTLARDRIGEKPLYYGFSGGVFMFGSTLHALEAFPGFDSKINRSALALFLRYNAIPSPHSIYQKLYKLQPGTILKITPENVMRKELATPSPYWSFREMAVEGQIKLFQGSEADAIAEVEYWLHKAISGQRIADVPLGAFLSGGVDSSTIVAIMQAQSTVPVKTFTIGFDESGYDEAGYARDVAKYLRTDHMDLYVNAQQALDVISRMQDIYDEPFADSSQIPAALISELASRQVTVSLSGDGGDELFGGYNRHVFAPAIWRKMCSLPINIRAALAAVILHVSPQSWDRIVDSLDAFLPRSWRHVNTGDKLHKLAGILHSRSAEEIYIELVSHWKNPGDVVLGGGDDVCVEQFLTSDPGITEFAHQMMYFDSVTYLPDDILVKLDRATMFSSLEARVPFLDHRLIEFTWCLPLSMKIGDGQGKRLLREVLYKYVPRELIERPKMGFTIPLDSWLRGPLKDWAEDLLEESRLMSEGYFNPVPIRRLWNEHLSQRKNWAYKLWGVLMFQAWSSSRGSQSLAKRTVVDVGQAHG